jgi:hypothetical protein
VSGQGWTDIGDDGFLLSEIKTFFKATEL